MLHNFKTTVFKRNLSVISIVNCSSLGLGWRQNKNVDRRMDVRVDRRRDRWMNII